MDEHITEGSVLQAELEVKHAKKRVLITKEVKYAKKRVLITKIIDELEMEIVELNAKNLTLRAQCMKAENWRRRLEFNFKHEIDTPMDDLLSPDE